LMSGRENAVSVDRYYESKLNFLGSTYTPNRFDYWIRFTAHSDDVITILLRDPSIRFKIYEEDGEKVIYDSKNKDSVHRNSNVGTWSCAEKIREETLEEEIEEFTFGQTYYLVLYSTTEGKTEGFIEKSFDVGIGYPMMAYGSTTISPRQRVTANSKSFSVSVPVNINRQVPEHAVVKSISYSGTSSSKIITFRAQKDGGVWKNSKNYSSSIDYTYTKDSSYNTKAIGNWNFSFKAASSKTSVTFTPSFKVYYYYEYGDEDGE